MKRITEIRIKYFIDGADGIIRVDEDTTNLEFAPTDNNEYVIQWVYKGIPVTKVIPKESVVDITLFFEKEGDGK